MDEIVMEIIKEWDNNDMGKIMCEWMGGWDNKVVREIMKEGENGWLKRETEQAHKIVSEIMKDWVWQSLKTEMR